MGFGMGWDELSESVTVDNLKTTRGRVSPFTVHSFSSQRALLRAHLAMPDRAMPESIPPTAVATLAHLGVKSAHRPHAAAVRELACNRSAADGPPGALCTLAVTADGPSLEEALGGAFDGP